MIINLSVIVLNYNNPELTRKCVDNITKKLEDTDLNFQIIVVDNSGSEKHNNFIPRKDEAIDLISNSINLGFAAANNQGIKAANGKFILLLNNDAFPDVKTIYHGVQFLETERRFDAWSAQLIGKNLELQITTANLPTVWTVLTEYFFLNRFFRAISKLRHQTLMSGQVESVIMAFFLVRKSVFDEIGLLDEDFFFTSEDVDFCKKMKNHNMQIFHDTNFQVLHYGGASQKEKIWYKQQYLHEARIKYFKKNHTTIEYFIVKYIIFFGLLVRKILLWKK